MESNFCSVLKESTLIGDFVVEQHEIKKTGVERQNFSWPSEPLRLPYDSEDEVL
jgi:hypothetical protein